MSNALGTINPIAEIVRIAHAAGVPVLVDGSQAAYHMPVDVQALGVDFYVATGHKLYGPTGIGVLYGREALLEAMPPFLGGGDMIASVTFEKSTWNELPYQVRGRHAAHRRRDRSRRGASTTSSPSASTRSAAHERDLLAYGTQMLEAIPGVRMIGTAPHKASILSFVMEGIHPHDIGTIVDREGVAIRTGHHCAQPVMDRFGIPATARASLAMYNTREEIDALGARAAEGQRGVRLMSALNELYQEVILDHNKRPRNFRAIDPASHHAEGYNPLCGDRLALYVQVDGDTIADVAFQGSAARSRRRRRR